MYKTILAPNAPWYTPREEKQKTIVAVKKTVKLKPAEKPRRISKMGKRFSLPKETDLKFEAWLNSLEKIK